MPQINISEDDFMAVAIAAHSAMEGGDPQNALQLDKLARKINLALSSCALPASVRFHGTRSRSWRDVPSTLGPGYD